MSEEHMNHVPLYVAIDVDRSLLDTGALTRLLTDMLTVYGITQQDAARTYEAIVAGDGGSIPLLDFIAERFGSDVRERLAADVLEAASTHPEELAHLLYDGDSQRVIDHLDRHDTAYSLLTFGEASTQRLKIDLMDRLMGGRRLPALITDQPRKGEWIAQASVETDSGLVLPADLTGDEVEAERVIVIDDKASNLVSPSSRVLGLLLDNTDPTRSIGALAARLEAGERLEDIAA